MFAVLPFGNRTVIETLTGAQLTEALTNGFSPVCDPTIATGRFPQVSGLKVTFRCAGTTAVVDSICKAPDGPAAPLTPVGPTDTVRLVTNDFMFTGGDGYTALPPGRTCCSPATPCSMSRSTGSPTTRRWHRRSKDGSYEAETTQTGGVRWSFGGTMTSIRSSPEMLLPASAT